MSVNITKVISFYEQGQLIRMTCMSHRIFQSNFCLHLDLSHGINYNVLTLLCQKIDCWISLFDHTQSQHAFIRQFVIALDTRVVVFVQEASRESVIENFI